MVCVTEYQENYYNNVPLFCFYISSQMPQGIGTPYLCYYRATSLMMFMIEIWILFWKWIIYVDLSITWIYWNCVSDKHDWLQLRL